MTLDSVHFDGILGLAERIRTGVDEGEHRDFAETVWESFLEPLVHEGRVVLEPLGQHRRRSVDVEAAALQEDPFPTRHGLDSGTINPTTFKNGLVMDVAQAAMSAVPSDLDLHRARTVVVTTHANDVTVDLATDEWVMDDAGYMQQRVIQAPRMDRFEQHVVHVLSLYLAESKHALTQADAVEDLLLLDGPLYPKGLLEWKGRDARLEDLLVESETPRAVVGNYLELVERFVDHGVPLLGFVKNPTARTVTRTIRAREGSAPWVNDTAFYKQVLDGVDDDTLACTGWFASRGGVDHVLSSDGDALGIDRTLDPREYEVTFFVVYDPREDQLFRIEAPYAFTKDPELRERLATQILQGVALGSGPPPAIGKSDELARISREEKAALRDGLERTFESDRERSYDEARWGVEYLEF